jgi:hypothetical protein
VAQTEALRALEDPGCPVCRVGAWTDERTIHALVTEHYTDGHVIAAVGDALGFCPAHVRRLARRLEAPYVLRLLYAEATRVALSRLRSPHALHRPAPCPVCESRGRSERATLRMLLHALARPSFAAAYSRHGGLCVPHAFAGLAEADPRRATTVIEALHGRLAHNTEHSQPLLDLAGEDTDRSARQWARTSLPPRPENLALPTLAELQERLALATCPACLAGGWMERGYLAWLGAQFVNNPGGLGAEGIWLCPQHLWDLATGPIGWAVEYHADRLKAEIDQRRGLIPSPVRGWLVWWLRDRRATRRVVAPLVRQRGCSACAAVETAERRELDLVVTGLTDQPTRAAYHESHGLCFRHAMARPCSTIHDVLKARLGVLVWELDEGGRKSAWSTRHEAHGNEATAWLRAPVQLDGHAFLGAPPPVGKTSGTGAD